jgi:hypothetical protein
MALTRGPVASITTGFDDRIKTNSLEYGIPKKYALIVVIETSGPRVQAIHLDGSLGSSSPSLDTKFDTLPA